MTEKEKELFQNYDIEKLNTVTIKIIDNIFYFNEDKIFIDTKIIVGQILKLGYPVLNGEWSKNTGRCNPLEADRSKNSVFYYKKYFTIREKENGDIRIVLTFPMFNKVFWLAFYLLKRVPDFEEYAWAYIYVCCEKCLDGVKDNSYLFLNHKPHTPMNLTKKIVFDNDTNNNQHYIFINELLSFRSKNNLPVNQFSTEQLLARLFKVYGSLVRDLSNPVIFASLGARVVYINNLDNKYGVDISVNNTPCFAYISTKSAIDIANEKQEERHPGLKKNNISKVNLVADVFGKTGLIIMTEEQAKEILNDISNKKIKPFYLVG